MSKRDRRGQRARKVTNPDRRVSDRRGDAAHENGLPASFSKASQLFEDRQYEKARGVYARLQESTGKADPQLRALIQNNLAVIAALEGKYDDAYQGWREAIASDADCLTARLNLENFEAEFIGFSEGSGHELERWASIQKL